LIVGGRRVASPPDVGADVGALGGAGVVACGGTRRARDCAESGGAETVSSAAASDRAANFLMAFGLLGFTWLAADEGAVERFDGAAARLDAR
jgi:hypothetical protein